ATRVWVPDASRGATGEGGPSPSDLSPAESITRLLGRFELVELLGRGGMGEVYRAVHTRLKKQVAVKLLPAERMNDPQAGARFRREIRLVGELSHPNLVRFENAGQDEGVHYLVMEYVPGVDLERLVRRLGPLPIEEACQLVGQAAVGLEHASRRGLVHRDIKPSNLMLSTTGAVKILDFGLAILKDSSEELTSSNRTVGTVEYLAPEQAEDSGSVDVRADIYSLGCTLFKLLSGRPPFDGEHASPQQIVLAHVETPPPDLQTLRPEAPDGLAEIVKRMLAKDPADRYLRPAEVAVALAPLARGCDVKRLLAQVDLATLPAPEVGSSSIDTADYLTSAATDPGTALKRRKPSVYEIDDVAPRPARPSRRPLWLAVGGFAFLAIAAVLAFAVPRWRRGAEPVPPAGPDGPHSVLSWDEAMWPDPLVTTREFTLGDVTMTISLTRDWNADPQLPLPQDDASLHGGLQPPEDSLVLVVSEAEPSMTASIEFSEPVRDVSFRLFDVDQASGHLPDRVAVRGFLFDQPTPVALSVNRANRLDEEGGAVRGASTASDTGQDSDVGNVQVTVSAPVDRIELELSRAAPANNEEKTLSGPQTVGLHDINFSLNRPFGAAHTLDWDEVEWRRMRYATFPVDGVDVTFALSGDDALAAGGDAGLRNSEATRTLLWRLPHREPHETAAASIHYSAPVTDVEFDLFDIDADAHRRRERVAVLGMRGGRQVTPAISELGSAVTKQDMRGPAAAWHPQEYASRVAKSSFSGSAAAPVLLGIAPADDATDAGKARVQFAEPVDRILVVVGVEAEDDGEESFPPPLTQQIAFSSLKFRKAPEEKAGGVARTRVIVPATANPYLAGAAAGASLGRDAALAEGAVEVRGLSLVHGRALTFSANGAVREKSGVVTRGPDGGSGLRAIDRSSTADADAAAPVGGLVGLLLSAEGGPVTQIQTPSSPEVSAALTHEVIAPKLGELFFIGDGRSSAGNVQQFVVPPGAERLFLGVMDGMDWCDNVGAFEVEVAAVESWEAELDVAAPWDLLAGVDEVRDVIDGQLTKEDESWRLAAAEEDRPALLQFPVIPPEAYRVELDIERVSGDGWLGVGLPVGREMCLAAFDEEGASGMWRSDESQAGIKTPVLTSAFPARERVAMALEVDGGGVRVERNGEPFFTSPVARPLAAADHAFYDGVLFLRSDGAEFRLHSVRLLPIAGAPRHVPFKPNASAERRAAERALWKGGKVQVVIAGTRSTYIERLEDLPPALRLDTIFDRDSDRGLAWDDNDLAILRGVPDLSALDLNRSRITDAGLADIAHLTGLEYLILSYTDVTNAGLAHLREMTQMEILFFVATEVGDAGLAELRGMKQLQRVGLSSTQVTDAGIAALAPSLAGVTWLCMCGATVTAESLPLLGKLDRLETLHLGGVPIGDADLPQLYGMKSLKEIRLAGTNVTDEGKAELQKQLPGLEFVP
ncbi:MAG: protein kinase, partial [Planctomycetes bacterium]|nr:protein kinase [Planctomycetota bacterium]